MLSGLTTNIVVRLNHKQGNHHSLNTLNGNSEISVINWCYHTTIISCLLGLTSNIDCKTLHPIILLDKSISFQLKSFN